MTSVYRYPSLNIDLLNPWLPAMMFREDVHYLLLHVFGAVKAFLFDATVYYSSGASS